MYALCIDGWVTCIPFLRGKNCLVFFSVVLFPCIYSAFYIIIIIKNTVYQIPNSLVLTTLMNLAKHRKSSIRPLICIHSKIQWVLSWWKSIGLFPGSSPNWLPNTSLMILMFPWSDLAWDPLELYSFGHSGCQPWGSWIVSTTFGDMEMQPSQQWRVWTFSLRTHA